MCSPIVVCGGVRWAALEVQDFDPVKLRLTVNKSCTEVNGTLVTTTPKSGKRRTVPGISMVGSRAYSVNSRSQTRCTVVSHATWKGQVPAEYTA